MTPTAKKGSGATNVTNKRSVKKRSRRKPLPPITFDEVIRLLYSAPKPHNKNTLIENVATGIKPPARTGTR